MYQHGIGYVMVRAKSDSVKDILAALKEGAFYSSCGPVIHDFYVEDGFAHIKCSPVSKIEFCADRHPNVVSPNRLRDPDAPLVTEASVSLSRHGGYRYIRASVVDEKGRRAWTNPIFLPGYEELEK